MCFTLRMNYKCLPSVHFPGTYFIGWENLSLWAKICYSGKKGRFKVLFLWLKNPESHPTKSSFSGLTWTLVLDDSSTKPIIRPWWRPIPGSQLRLHPPTAIKYHKDTGMDQGDKSYPFPHWNTQLYLWNRASSGFARLDRVFQEGYKYWVYFIHVFHADQ